MTMYGSDEQYKVGTIIRGKGSNGRPLTGSHGNEEPWSLFLDKSECSHCSKICFRSLQLPITNVQLQL